MLEVNPISWFTGKVDVNISGVRKKTKESGRDSIIVAWVRNRTTWESLNWGFPLGWKNLYIDTLSWYIMRTGEPFGSCEDCGLDEVELFGGLCEDCESEMFATFWTGDWEKPLYRVTLWYSMAKHPWAHLSLKQIYANTKALRRIRKEMEKELEGELTI